MRNPDLKYKRKVDQKPENHVENSAFNRKFFTFDSTLVILRLVRGHSVRDCQGVRIRARWSIVKDWYWAGRVVIWPSLS